MAADPPPRRILAREFGLALVDAGLVHGPADEIRRIIIDVDPDEPLTVYVEYYADERWLGIAPMVTGAQIVTKQ